MSDESSGVFLGPGEGTVFTARGGRMVFKALSETTSGAFSLMERELPVSGRWPQPHTHDGPEGFYVLDGSIEFVVDAEARVGGPGFWALVPGHVAHTFGNAGDVPARLLIIHAPGADAYFAELQYLWAGNASPTAEDERSLMMRHGIEPVG